MVKSILEIGNAKYQIDRHALKRAMREAQEYAALQEVRDKGEVPDLDGREGAAFSADESMETIFDEVMRLYNEYAMSGNLKVLLKLKCTLEQVSLRYRSLELAEEVLNINSCLPYEVRVRCSRGQEH